MIIADQYAIIKNVDISLEYTSNIQEKKNYANFSLGVFWEGSPVGEFYMEISHDKTNWQKHKEVVLNLPDSGNDTQDVVFNCVNQKYFYYRFRFIPTSGSGNLTVFLNTDF